MHQHLSEVANALAAQSYENEEQFHSALQRALAVSAGIGADRPTLPDVLNALADGRVRRDEAVLILQGMAYFDFPRTCQRPIVALCEASLPVVCRRLEIESRQQTYEKYDSLQKTFGIVEDAIEPLRRTKGEPDVFTERRQTIIHSLRQGVVKEFCAPFDVEAITSSVTAVLGRLDDINLDNTDLVYAISICDELVSEEIRLARERPHFLGLAYSEFLEAVDAGLRDFKTRVRGHFTAEIRVRGKPGELTKRYPLHEAGRELNFVVPLTNIGPGRALGVRACIQSNDENVWFDANEVALGDIAAGDFNLEINGLVIKPCDTLGAMMEVSWQEVGGAERKKELFELRALAQNKNVDWSSLEFTQPYTTGVARGDEFVGRSERRKAMANKLLRSPMESFYVSGQKRVGKTSLVIAACDLAVEQSQTQDLAYKYLLWGQLAHVDPKESLRVLGEQMAELIGDSLPSDINLPSVSFEGSLSGITKLADVALKYVPGKKFVVVIDEFDEIHPDLYIAGPLAETFFANLRAITNYPNMSLVLVGGENMPFIIDRQGQKLNKLSSISLDYYSRAKEWSDFRDLVRAPTKDSINWHDEAITQVFAHSNGNPYFAKIICGEAFRKAVEERDADITSEEVQRAVRNVVSSSDANSFAHLWQDGIFKPIAEREPDILRRCRVLVATARTLRLSQPVNLVNVAANKHSLVPADEIQAVLNEFSRRAVMVERNREYEFTLPIFRDWLMEVGMARLSYDAITEDLALAAQQSEDAAFVTSAEIAELTSRWPTYQGRRIGADDVRAWLDQVPTHLERRLLFTLLQHVKFFSEQWIREKLKVAHGFVRNSIPQFVKTKRRERREDILVVYIDGEAKSGQFYASRYAEENDISSTNVVSGANLTTLLSSRMKEGRRVNAIVVVDDIVSSGRSLSENLETMVAAHEDALRVLGKPLLAIALTATVAGEQHVRKALAKFEWLDFDIRVCHMLSADEFAFAERPGIWLTEERYDRAKALATDLGVKVYRRSPLGYGSQGLLVVFPETCPNNSLPILHSAGSAREGGWKPLFRRPVN